MPTVATKLCETCKVNELGRLSKRFCSKVCYWNSKTRKTEYSCTSCGEHTSAKSVQLCKQCLNIKMRDENHPNWKGALVQYRALHHWVQKHLGTPNTCESCRATGTGHSMHWANISKEYKRELSDWVRLCPSCHKDFDLQKDTLIKDII